MDVLNLSKLKKYLGIQNADKDDILDFVLEDVEESIRNYCNIKEVPVGLTNTAYRMAMDVYRNENIGEEEEAFMVTSLTEGDTATGFSKQSSAEYTQSVLKNYESQLKRYRKVVF